MDAKIRYEFLPRRRPKNHDPMHLSIRRGKNWKEGGSKKKVLGKGEEKTRGKSQQKQDVGNYLPTTRTFKPKRRLTVSLSTRDLGKEEGKVSLWEKKPGGKSDTVDRSGKTSETQKR